MKYISPLYHDTKNQMYNIICQSLVATMYVMFGCIFKRINIKMSINTAIYAAILSYSFMIVVGSEPMVMSWSEYPSKFRLHLLSSLFGAFFIILLSHALSNIRLFAYFGEKSKYIMAWHMASFVVLDLCFIWMGKFTVEGDSGIFNRYQSQYWWPIYAIFGIMLPIFIDIFITKCRNRSNTLIKFGVRN